MALGLLQVVHSTKSLQSWGATAHGWTDQEGSNPQRLHMLSSFFKLTNQMSHLLVSLVEPLS